MELTTLIGWWEIRTKNKLRNSFYGSFIFHFQFKFFPENSSTVSDFGKKSLTFCNCNRFFLRLNVSFSQKPSKIVQFGRLVLPFSVKKINNVSISFSLQLLLFYLISLGKISSFPIIFHNFLDSKIFTFGFLHLYSTEIPRNNFHPFWMKKYPSIVSNVYQLFGPATIYKIELPPVVASFAFRQSLLSIRFLVW